MRATDDGKAPRESVPRAPYGEGSRVGPAEARWFIFILEIIIISPLVGRTVLYFHFLATHFRTTQPPPKIPPITSNQHASPTIVLAADAAIASAVGEFRLRKGDTHNLLSSVCPPVLMVCEEKAK